MQAMIFRRLRDGFNRRALCNISTYNLRVIKSGVTDVSSIRERLLFINRVLVRKAPTEKPALFSGEQMSQLCGYGSSPIHR